MGALGKALGVLPLSATGHRACGEERARSSPQEQGTQEPIREWSAGAGCAGEGVQEQGAQEQGAQEQGAQEQGPQKKGAQEQGAQEWCAQEKGGSCESGLLRSTVIGWGGTLLRSKELRST